MTAILGSDGNPASKKQGDRRSETPLERMLAKYGLATILALMFFYWLTGGVTKDIAEIKAAQLQHDTETAYYMWRVCQNTAKDETQLAACIPPKR